MTKLTVVGRGTAGCFSVLHYLYHTDLEIDWIYDPRIPPVPVGEGTDLRVPRELHRKLGGFFTHDLLAIGGTVKYGIQKDGWGGSGSYLNPFPITSYGIHMDAGALQDYIIQKISSNPRINIIEGYVNDPESLDSDYVMMATGTPKSFGDNFIMADSIPVNAAYVTQCYWDYPRFGPTQAIARPWGWVFAIPLQKRCSIGYIFNHHITDIDVIKEDVKEVFEQFGLVPSEKTNFIKFANYYRHNPIGDKVVYNGNGAFFLEPLEATSITSAYNIDVLAWRAWFGGYSMDACNLAWRTKIRQIEQIIAAHYTAGSIYKNEFWDYAKETAATQFDTLLSTDQYSREWLKQAMFDGGKSHYTQSIANDAPYTEADKVDFGTWDSTIWNLNMKNLGLTSRILNS